MKKIFFSVSIFSLIFSYHNSYAQWVQVNNGLNNTYGVTSIASGGNNIFAAQIHNQTIGGRGVNLTTNNGSSWTQTSLSNQLLTWSLAVKENYVFAGTNFGVYLSTDNGATWNQSSLNNHVFKTIVVNGNYVFAGDNFGSGVYLSTNNGANWAQTSLNNHEIISLAAYGNNIFAGTYNNNGVYLSTNNGSSWTQTSLNNKNVLALAVSENNVFAGTDSNGVYRSTNNGSTWTQTSLNNILVSSIAISGNFVFVGSWGVYESTDNGTSWIIRNEGLYLGVRVLCITSNYIFACTAQSGVYRRPLGELVGIQPISNEIPKAFSLSQNYPNPFNPTTKIKFAISGSSVAQTFLSVYDILGREVATLVNESLKPGSYEVQWNAANFPSGVYYYKLVVGDNTNNGGFTETKRMILIK